MAVQRVRLDEIDGVDEDLQEFIRENDLLIELNLQLDRWAPECLRWTVQRLNLPLWRRKNRLVHLGSGPMLTLARRIVHHEDLITATVIQNKTLQKSQKLLVLGEELLFQAALARTSAMPTPQAAALCMQLEQAGRQMLRRTDARQFAQATGIGHAAARQHWPVAEPAAAASSLTPLQAAVPNSTSRQAALRRESDPLSLPPGGPARRRSRCEWHGRARSAGGARTTSAAQTPTAGLGRHSATPRRPAA